MLYCSRCGQHYPENYNTSTCRVCGGLIEPARWCKFKGPSTLLYTVDQMWRDWQVKMASAPPRPMTEMDWYEACAHFNGCAICGLDSVDNRSLLVPVQEGGKYYSYNILPTCATCGKLVAKRRKLNSFRVYMAALDNNLQRFDSILGYLETKMLGAIFEEFDFEHDNIEVICKVTEDTSIKPFDGIYARRLFKYPSKIITTDNSFITYRSEEENIGVTWRLVDDEE